MEGFYILMRLYNMALNFKVYSLNNKNMTYNDFFVSLLRKSLYF